MRAIAGVVLRGLDLELGDGVGIGDGAGGVRSVNGVAARRRASVHVHRAGSPAQGSGIVHIRGSARRHRENLRKVAGGQRHAGDGFMIHQGT